MGFLDKRSPHSLVIPACIALAVVILSYSAVSTLAVSSNNIATINKFTTVKDVSYTIMTDGTKTYAQNGNTGAIDYSGTNAATVIQSAIDAQGSKELSITDGTYALGTTSLHVRTDGFKIHGTSEEGAIFTFTGTGAAIDVSKTSGTISRVEIDKLKLDLSGDGASSVGIKATQYSQFTVRDTMIQGDNGVALYLDGGATWSAYGYFENVRIAGSFTKGVYLTGTGPSTNNANTFINVVGIYSPGVGPSTTYGIYLDHGDTNVFIGGDLDSWGTGMKVNDGLNRLVGSRFEGNAVDMNFTSSSHENMMVGVSEDASPVFVDSGTDNHRMDRFATVLPNIDTLRSKAENTIMNIQSQRSVSGSAIQFQSENENFNGLLTRMIIQGGSTVANTKVQLPNAGLDMFGNNFAGIRTSGADPTTSDLQSGEWQLNKNTNTGAVKLCYNDAGSIKCATLS